jgi:acetyl-CoA carboxylase biotin carboxyl carrier protein
MTSELELLASLIDSYGLTRLEYEQGELRVVMERQVAPGEQAPSSAASNQSGIQTPSSGVWAAAPASAPASAPVAALTTTLAAADATAPATSASSAAAAPATLASNAAASNALTLVTVTAPLLGVVYRSREPSATPLAACGQRVVEGDAVCLIEAMKLFNEITAPVSGVIDAVLFEDGDLAEYGAPLITILPDTD